jgi:hypothetical protein
VSDRFDATYYEDMRGRARGLLIAVAGRFTAAEVAVIDELIDANEPGVALEMLCQMLADSDVPVETRIIDQLSCLAREMGMANLAARSQTLSAGPGKSR